MSSLRQLPTIGRRALAAIVACAVVVGLVIVFSGSLTRSTDTESQAEQSRAEVQARQRVLEETEAEQAFIESREFILWQARVNGWGRAGEIRFALPEGAPEPAPIRPIGPQDEEPPLAPFDAWMELLFGA